MFLVAHLIVDGLEADILRLDLHLTFHGPFLALILRIHRVESDVLCTDREVAVLGKGALIVVHVQSHARSPDADAGSYVRMQVAVAVGCCNVNTLCHYRHRGTRALLLEVVAGLDGTLLLLQRLLAAVYLCQLRHEFDKGLGGAIDRRQQSLHLPMNLADVSEVGEGAVILLIVQFFLFLGQFDHILQEFVHRFLLVLYILLQVLALSIQILDDILDLLLTPLGCDGCLDAESLVGMQANATTTSMQGHL